MHFNESYGCSNENENKNLKKLLQAVCVSN